MKIRILIYVVLATLLAYSCKAIPESHQADFERYYYAGSATLGDGDIYSRQDDKQFKYFPVFAQMMAPIAWFSETATGGNPKAPSGDGLFVGAGIWYVLLCAAWSISVILAVRMTKPDNETQALIIALAAIAFSARFLVANLRNGQVNMLVMALAVIGCWLALKGWRKSAGVFIAAGTCLKFMPVVLLLWFARRGWWSGIISSAAAIIFFLLVIPSVTWGIAGNKELLTDYIQARNKMVTAMPEEEAAGQSLPSLANRLLRKVNATALRKKKSLYINITELSSSTTGVVSLTLVCLAICTTIAVVRGEPGILEVGLFFILMLLISPEARKAHFVTVLIPAAALVSWSLRHAACAVPKGALAIAFVLLALTSQGIIGESRFYDLLNAYAVLVPGIIALAVGLIWCMRKT